MPDQVYVVTFQSDHVPAWERCTLKEAIGGAVRMVLEWDQGEVVAIDQHEEQGDNNAARATI